MLWSFVKSRKIFYVEDRNESIVEERKKDTEGYQTIGWVRVQGTNIDMPIITIGNNDPPVDREHYSWTLNEDDQFYNVINILGHNVFNLSSTPYLHSDMFQRFEELMDFVYYDFAKENQYIQLTIDNQNYIYKIFSVRFLPSYHLYFFPTGNYSKTEKKRYLNLLKSGSIYDYHVDVDSNDSLLSLITCTRFYGADTKKDLIVTGRLVHKGELASQYKVSKNDNYQEIEKKLEGVDINEKDDYA